MLLKKQVKNSNNNLDNTAIAQETSRQEGEVSIDKTPKQDGNSNKDVGEYVDYEEID